LLFVSFNTQKVQFLTNFCNPEIPGLGRRQFRDSELAKTAGIPNSGIANTTVDTLKWWAKLVKSNC